MEKIHLKYEVILEKTMKQFSNIEDFSDTENLDKIEKIRV